MFNNLKAQIKKLRLLASWDVDWHGMTGNKNSAGRDRKIWNKLQALGQVHRIDVVSADTKSTEKMMQWDQLVLLESTYRTIKLVVTFKALKGSQAVK